MKRRTWLLLLALAAAVLPAQTDTPLDNALQADPGQAQYLARHPEILRWIGKRPRAVAALLAGTLAAEERAKNNLINEWITGFPKLARLLADAPNQTLAWADDPQQLMDLSKKRR